MKKITLVIALIGILLSCKAQVIPVQNSINYLINDTNIPDGTYLKDVDNLFDKFIGTWTGTINNKNYEFVITKITTEYIGISTDKLLLKYRITDLMDNVLVETINLSNDSEYVIKGIHFLENGETYQLIYGGYEVLCGQSGDVFIAVINNNSQLNFILYPDGEIEPSSCPNGQVDQILPTELITLDKQ
ncbi:MULTISPECIES: DUF6705 family protein [Bizionia]|uniref:DUF6705 domain-containing protein n=1 Tax=Bizionia algoritergicola TaxID=291187 RepID=A0A5D0R055_9FLAO|nr:MULTISPECIES: DUF6705 family protein [Bizionia]OBX23568.1 hypothetical protein BAA08_04245 [Bizionia sp. APA-3]TYB74900.1 hypothetical protein ES675_01820 [Bizionia algoritergicola]